VFTDEGGQPLPPKKIADARQELPKARSGIEGFDEVTDGGLPLGRPTLVVGGPGTGKTLFGMHFLVNGAIKYKEPGVLISFEETEKELAQNVASLGFDVKGLLNKKLLVIDQVKVESSEIIETGEYDLEGLFVRIGYAIDSIGAKRVVLDTIEAIFSTFENSIILRSEMRRLFQFLKDKGVTSIVTGESGNGALTRDGLEEYVSDAVVSLENRVQGNITTRRMRIIKYRGSSHGSNEYPFLIDENGFSVVPITSIGLTAKVSDERISTGIKGLDDMMRGKGYFKESTILITGHAGTGKTTFAAEFLREACGKGKKALFFTYEESESQVIRNMRSVGVDLQPFINRSLLKIVPDRPASYGLETHLVSIHKLTRGFKPEVVVIDPISSLMTIGEEVDVRSTMARIVDYLKMNHITALFTDLWHAHEDAQTSLISSMVDTWIMLENIRSNGEDNRVLRMVKSRGMAHSNQIMEFRITEKGIELIPPYVGPSGVLIGSARYAQEARERAEEISSTEDTERAKRRLEYERNQLQSQLSELKAQLDDKELELHKWTMDQKRRKKANERYQTGMRSMRNPVKKGGKP
jgi:circadian clock protein KaiC